jgi:hypothetical protein
VFLYPSFCRIINEATDNKVTLKYQKRINVIFMIRHHIEHELSQEWVEEVQAVISSHSFRRD